MIVRNNSLKTGILLSLALTAFSCGRASLESVPAAVTAPGAGTPGDGGNGSQDVGDGGTVAPPAATPTPAPALVSKMEPLSWESSRADAKNWSTYAFQVIREEAFTDLHKARDIETFCPKYDTLTQEQQINVWGALFSGVSKYESGYSPTSRMQETTMGTDPITNKPVYSEGLLQLSYQDTQWAPYCEFDWSKDKYLAATDPKKTILDPYKNLRCGILILARQVRAKGAVVLSSGVYWAVLKSGGKYQQITNIANIVKKLSFCK